MMNDPILLFLGVSMRFLALVIVMLMGGCTAHHKWTVGDTTVHLLVYEGVAGPNVSSVWSEREGKVVPVYNASGTGLAPSLVAGSAQVGAAHLIGEGLSNSGDNISLNQGGASATGGSATGGNSNATGGTATARSRATGGDGGNSNATGGSSRNVNQNGVINNND